MSDTEVGRVPAQHTERWCNQVAAELLMPLAMVQAAYPRDALVFDEIHRLAREFKVSALVVVGMVASSGRFEAQDRLDRMPGVAEFRKMQTALQGGAFVSGAITPTWAEDSRAFTYTHDGSRFRFDVGTMAAVNEGAVPAGAAGGRGSR